MRELSVELAANYQVLLTQPMRVVEGNINSGIGFLEESCILPLLSIMAGRNIETCESTSEQDTTNKEEEYLVTIKLTEEKEEAIMAFFAHNNWEYVKLKTVKCSKRRKLCSAEQSYSQAVPDQDPEFEQPVDPDQECRYCLLTPCVTLKTYTWEGDGQRACDDNPGIRHKLYTRYWWVIANKGGWNDERYVAKKRNVGGGEWAVSHRREIMPLCVLMKTRSLYPNIEGQPYLGHKWE